MSVINRNYVLIKTLDDVRPVFILYVNEIDYVSVFPSTKSTSFPSFNKYINKNKNKLVFVSVEPSFVYSS